MEIEYPTAPIASELLLNALFCVCVNIDADFNSKAKSADRLQECCTDAAQSYNNHASLTNRQYSRTLMPPMTFADFLNCYSIWLGGYCGTRPRSMAALRLYMLHRQEDPRKLTDSWWAEMQARWPKSTGADEVEKTANA